MSKRSLYKEFYGIQDNIEEAELLNRITDYEGGVVYKLHDPSTYEIVKSNVMQFAKKRKLYLIKEKYSAKRGIGYFYFRLGEDPGKEAQRVQGFLSQLPEISSFKFQVLQKKKPTPPAV